LLLESAWQSMKQRPEMAAAFKEQINAPGVAYAFDGRYILVPGNKLYYERHVRLADSEGWFKMVADGATYWIMQDLGREKRVQTFKLADLFQALEDLNVEELGKSKVDQLRLEARGEFGLGGFEPMFRDWHNRLTIARAESTVLKRPGDKEELPIYLLEGTWNKQFRDQIVPPTKPGEARGPTPEDLWNTRRVGINAPRSCKLYLGRGSAWPFLSSFFPYRVEWYGPAQPGGGDVLLAAIDFDPIAPTATFSLAPAEQQEAKPIKPSDWVEGRRALLKQQKEMEEQRGQRREGR
jgi:hypothetical protein